MKSKIGIAIIGAVVILGAVACSAPASAAPVAQQAPAAQQVTNIVVPSQPAASATLPAPAKQPSGPVKATWINATTSGDAVTIPLSAVYDDFDTHFKVQMASGTETFMAYFWNGAVYVRANICPPCRSIGFTLNKDILVCDTCGTTFQAKSGAGIAGACVAYPKASVPYKITDNNIVMNTNDLVNAYQKTVAGKGAS
jgi:hypothetical protein